jgi:alginate O-acetyltransferase complex protein AlgI
MLFNSYEFIFIFLPISLFGFHLIGKRYDHRVAITWLVAVSLFFYGWWNPAYIGLMLFSIIFNYNFGILLSRDTNYKLSKKALIIIAVLTNLIMLAYFKYANFFIDNLNLLSGNSFNFQKIILPLAISFFTFQQIAYLVDAYRSKTKEYGFLHYCLFVTFFPQLIAGPIVHHKEMLSQFSKDMTYKLRSSHISIGLTIFSIGLFKKVVLADGVSVYATPVFDTAESEVLLTFFEAWGGVLAYTFQLYFDFSGYSDMAIGIARMFGIHLPVNFNSPYKATSIIDFWKRWHITLSCFLRDYLYFPLGGNRKGNARRHINIMITMVLGGLWHGAGWTFVLWGCLHGFYLIINHGWRSLFGSREKTKNRSFWAWVVTFLAVTIAWVPFRAESIHGVENILGGMIGLHGYILPESYLYYFNHLYDFGDYLVAVGWQFSDAGLFRGLGQILSFFLLILILAFLPNTQQIMRQFKIESKDFKYKNTSIFSNRLSWQPTVKWAMFTSIILVLSIINLTSVSEFLYFQF